MCPLSCLFSLSPPPVSYAPCTPVFPFFHLIRCLACVPDTFPGILFAATIFDQPFFASVFHGLLLVSCFIRVSLPPFASVATVLALCTKPHDHWAHGCPDTPQPQHHPHVVVDHTPLVLNMYVTDFSEVPLTLFRAGGGHIVPPLSELRKLLRPNNVSNKIALLWSLSGT